ncbi:MAG: glycoside hydrolase family 27 protein [Gemmatimonadetes bacterium]|nr:glycoside hydrolase family 27 protein [Gemmatimonadota bacterium]
MKRTPAFSFVVALLVAVIASCARGPATPGSGASAFPLLAATPPMGFNTWNRFGCNVSDTLVRGMADAMVSSGMKDAGYQYVVIDDCWQVDRDSTGRIVADPERFPNGIKALADYVHEQGLKFGIYTDAGTKTCQGRPGSYGHEDQDARTYAEWGVDYVKVDWCYADSLNAPERYTIVRDAFRKSGRPLVLSICEWGQNDPWEWADTVGQLWRTTGDIYDGWQSVLWIADANNEHQAVAGPGHWNDPDMLEVGNGGMTLDEYRAHFSLWATMAAPLMAGNDLRHMSDDIRDILTNGEVIAVDQDSLGIQGRVVLDRGYGVQVWAKPLADGGAAVTVFNQRADSARAYVRWADVGLENGPATVRDLWAHQDLGVHDDTGVFADRLRVRVPGHGVVMLRITPAR